MKCPKCDYISFGDAERCSNCGYDTTTASIGAPTVDLELRSSPAVEGPPKDLTLGAPPPAPVSQRPTGARDARPAMQANDLPLFDRPVVGVDDTPLLTVAAPPRSPLSVRRGAADAPRVVPPPSAAGLAERESRARRQAESAAAASALAAAEGESDETADPSSPSWPRLLAVAIDAAILGALDLAVIYFTLQVTGLDAAHASRLPKVPLVAFLLLLDFGYLVGFTTAAGQTIGKMVAGIQVVADRTLRVPLGQAIIRAASVGLTILSLGVGYLPALIGRDRRALHDRLSGTRVLRR